MNDCTPSTSPPGKHNIYALRVFSSILTIPLIDLQTLPRPPTPDHEGSGCFAPSLSCRTQSFTSPP